MYNIIDRLRQLWTSYPVFVVMIVFTFLASVVSRCNLLDPVKFVSVQMAFIYLPGFALQRLTRLSYQNTLVRGLVSYATGYSVSLLVYLTLLMIGAQHLVLYAYIGISIISASYLYYTQKTVCDGEITRKEKLYFSYIMLAALVASMVLFQFPNLNPELKDSNTSLNQDLVFWMRNAVAATKGYPLPELSVAGKEFFYHYFTSINLAFLKFTTGIEMYDLCFVYSYLITIFILVSGLYVACQELISSHKLVFVAMCFVLFTQNLDTFTHIYFNDHLLKASFGFAEGMGMFFFTLYFYIRILRNENAKWALLLITMLLFFATSGLKGPLAAVLLVGIAVGSLLMMFYRNRFIYGAVSGVALLIVFLFSIGLFVININGGETVGNHAGLSLSAVDTIFHSQYYKIVYLFMLQMGLWKLISYMVIFVVYLISAILIPFIVYLITYSKRKRTDSEILLLIMVFVGIGLGMFVSQGGMSQGYFIFLAIPLFFMLSFIRITEDDYLKLIKRVRTVFIFGLFLFVAQYLQSVISGVYSMIRSSSDMIAFVEKVRPLGETSETGLTINEKEIVGLRWLRDNTPSDAIILSNKVLSNIMGSRSFWVSSLSERQAFFESYDYSNVSKETIKSRCDLINSFYEGNEEAYKNIKNMKVTYAVVFSEIIPNSYPKECKEIFKNDKITILEL